MMVGGIETTVPDRPRWPDTKVIRDPAEYNVLLLQMRAENGEPAFHHRSWLNIPWSDVKHPQEAYALAKAELYDFLCIDDSGVC